MHGLPYLCIYMYTPNPDVQAAAREEEKEKNGREGESIMAQAVKASIQAFMLPATGVNA